MGFVNVNRRAAAAAALVPAKIMNYSKALRTHGLMRHKCRSKEVTAGSPSQKMPNCLLFRTKRGWQRWAISFLSELWTDICDFVRDPEWLRGFCSHPHSILNVSFSELGRLDR